jgi:hypothetical protein
MPDRRRSLAGIAVVVLMLAVQASAPGSATAAPVAESHRVALGVYVPEALSRPDRIDSYARLVGRKPAIISAYIRWSSPPFVRAELEDVWKRGGVPMITWEPWTVADRGVPLSAIADGAYDPYVRDAAQAAAAWGHPVLLRFAQEMNGTWYPWGRGKDGNTAALYKRAWMHLVGIFRGYHARNVEWVWTPNENSSGRFPFAQYYPGDRWVEWVGLDGYNWGSAGDWSSFTEVFAASYNALRRITSRPMMITETGSNETGGNKAAWVASALRREIPEFTGIRAVIWFDARFPRVDARVDSSGAALRAFRAAVRSPRYAPTRAEFLASAHTRYRAGVAPSAPGGGYGRPSLAYRLAHKLRGMYLWYAIGIVLVTCGGLGVSCAFLARRLRAAGKRNLA